MTRVHTPRLGCGAEGVLEFTTPTPGCDFCGAELADRWTRFDCADFVRSIPGTPFGVRMVGFWAACAPCAPLVRARAWRRLARHVTRVRVAAGCPEATRADVRSELVALYLQLERHLTGDEQPGGGV